MTMPTVFPYLFPVLLAVSSLGWGRLILAPLRLRFAGFSESFSVRALAGLGTLILILLFAGLAGYFYPAVLWSVLALGALAAVLPHPGLPMPKNPFRNMRSSVLFSGLLGVLTVVTVAAAFARLRIPVSTADELSYHLYLPKLFLMKHRIFYWPYHVNSAFPLGVEILHAYGVSLGNDFAAKSVHFLFGLLTSFSLYALAKGLPGFPALWPALLWLTVPCVSHQMGLANNDLALTAFLAGAYLALFRWRGSKKEEYRWLVVAGLLSGFAMGVKYLAVFAVAIQLLLISAWSLSSAEGTKRLPAVWLAFLFPLAVSSGVWYARSFLDTGNPFYPYLTSFFGGRGLDNPMGLEGKGMGKDVWALISLPWNATFHPERFGGLSNQWGPLFLAFLPWIFWVERRDSSWVNALSVAGLSTLAWFYAKQNLRFLLPASPFWVLAVCVITERLRRGKAWLALIASFFLLVFAGLHGAIAVYQLRDSHRVVLGRETREAYLLRHEPSFGASLLVNREALSGPVKMLSEEHRAYYFNAEVVRERAYRRLTHYDEIFATRREAFFDNLRAEGFTHVLVKGEGNNPPESFLAAAMAQLAGPAGWAGPASPRGHSPLDQAGPRLSGRSGPYLLYKL
jgi:hypothetical protein